MNYFGVEEVTKAQDINYQTLI
uniref:Uncharacterized protein n=1 Tax=Rhizophora mucronata TaxID=61149 RepID=A0A2P2JW14_RHIMU